MPIFLAFGTVGEMGVEWAKVINLMEALKKSMKGMRKKGRVPQKGTAAAGKKEKAVAKKKESAMNLIRDPQKNTRESGFDVVEAFVEIPRGSRNKYESDHRRGIIFLDRVLFSSVHYPTDYGFIPGTRAADGDPLDVLVIVEEPTFPGCRIKIRPIGMLLMRDEKGLDEKILAVPIADPRFEGIKDIGDIQKHWLVEIENFFNIYKELEGGKQTHVEGWKRAEEAKTVLRKYWAAEGLQAEGNCS